MFRLLNFIHGCETYPPASEASRKVANLTEKENLHTPIYGVKFLTGNNDPDSPHSQVGMKFATQISHIIISTHHP